MSYGIIYIAHNPRDGENIFKVGKTERQIHHRLKELTSSTSNLGSYQAIAYFVVNDIHQAEATCHKKLRAYRVQYNREFFEIPLEYLLQYVRAAVTPFSAVDYLPDEFIKKGNPKTKNINPPLRSVAQRLQKINETREEERIKIDEINNIIADALISPITNLCELARRVELEFKGNRLIKWEIPKIIDKEFTCNIPIIRSHTIISVYIYSEISEQPLKLSFGAWISDGGNPVDRPKAIDEIKITKNGDRPCYEWHEMDDGIIGCFDFAILVTGNIDEIHGLDEISFGLSLRTSEIRYTNGCLGHWEDLGINTFKFAINNWDFLDEKIEEVFDVLVDAIIENLTPPLVDVRLLEKNSITSYIVDSGYLRYEAIKNYAHSHES